MICHIRFAAPAFLLALAAGFAGCNSVTGSIAKAAPAPVVPAASTYATERYAPEGFKLPEGSGCSGDIARYRAIMDNDYKSGNVNQSVYAQIETEIERAAAACAAGHDAEARGIVRQSRSRHGYPAG